MIMKLTHLLGIFALGSLASCGDSPTLNTTPPVNNPTPGPVETDYYVSPSTTECLTEVTGETWHGLEHILGCGYDITGSYLSVASMRGSVIDLGKLTDGRLVVLSAPAFSSGELFAGSDSKAFLADLMANAGLEYTPSDNNLCFAGTLLSASGIATPLMTVTWNRKLSGRFETFPYVLESALADEFASDIQYMRARTLVDRYGTHFFVHANVGVSVKTLYSAYVDAEGSEKTALARKGFEAAETALLGKLGPDLTLTLAGLGNYGASLSKVFNGGDPELVDYNPETGILGDNGVWMDSGSRDNYALTDISEGDLLPLSAAISDPDLKEEVDAEIRRRIAESLAAQDATVPLLQNTDGRLYRYVTGYDESMRLENEEGLHSFGVLGALYTKPIDDDTLPLYTRVDEGGSQILSLIQPDDSWTVMGYVMKTRSFKTVSLYEISDGSRYAYTIEAANSYGPRNEWHPTGAVFYLLRP